MKNTAATILLCMMFSFSYAQVEETGPPIKAEQQLENLTEATEAETEDDSYLQSLEQFRKNKINLNTAGVNDLKELLLLTDLQIQSLIRYRSLLGNFISIYELQAIPAWDVETVKRLLPFIKVGAAEPWQSTLKQKFSGGQHTLLARVQQVVEKSDGFARPDSIVNRYPGSRQRLFVRYKYVYRNLLQYGVTADKDAGEQFFNGKQQSGFDFYSFHLFMRNSGVIKSLALGDFTVNMGQGLIQWQSLAFKKSSDVLAVKRQAEVLRPYNSSGEYNFHRGAGITLAKNNVELTAFASIRKLDANFNNDTTTANDDYVSSVLTAGYHRTPTEINHKGQLQQTTFGGNITYNRNGFHAALNGITYTFSPPLRRDLEPYNKFAIQGGHWQNYSVDYSYTYRNVHFFGEAATDENNSKAFINGLLVSLDPAIDASLVYRNVGMKYQSLNGNAFTESTLPANEKGLYAALTLRPVPYITFDAYADLFRFPWLRFRVDAPGTGSEYMVQLTYKPGKSVEVYTRYRNENKPANEYGLSLPMRPVINRAKQNWRVQFNYRPTREILLRSRVDLVWYDSADKVLAGQGFTSYFDFGYNPLNKPYRINARLQYFETDGFDSRLYTFESDVLYSYSIPFFAGKGMRYYVNFNYDLTKKMRCWLRFAETIYRDQSTTGSGLDAINGNKKTEVKVQLMYNF